MIDEAKIYSPSVVDNGGSWRQKQIRSGELRLSPLASYFFPYLRDRRYTSSSVREQIEAFDLPEVTISEAQKTADDLGIKGLLVITLSIPEGVKNRDVVPVIPDMDQNSYIIPELGFGGLARFTGDRVRLHFDPANPHLIDNLPTRYPRMVAHELNHLARFQKTGRSKTLLDSLVSEGLAVTYEEQWNGEYLASRWGRALNEATLMSEWERAKKELHSQRYYHGEWFFGYNRKHPLWAGYALGTAIVDGFMANHPNITMRDAVWVPSADILRGSGFEAPCF